jgi:transcriptional regulator with XRE-family HTH domain
MGCKSAVLLREARLRAGLTQAELAARIGTTQSAISRWEGGGARPPLDTLRRLVDACGLELRLELVEPNPGEAGQIERNLSLSPEERLDQLLRALDFIAAGRRALAEAQEAGPARRGRDG